MSDHIQDKNHTQLYSLYNQVQFPEFMKEASLTTEEDVKDLPARAFADPVNRRFPIHTKADTWLSTLFFHKTAAVFPNRKTIDKILEKAAKLWNLSEEREKLQEQLDALEGSFEKKASVNTIEYRVDGQTVASTEVDRPEHLQKVARDLIFNPSKYCYSTRQEVAQQLLEKAAQMGHTFSKESTKVLQKTAGYGTTTKDNALSIVKQRSFVYKHEGELTGLNQRFEKIASFISNQGDLIEPSVLHKTAAALDAIDRAAGNHIRYGDAYPAPEQELFTITLQDAKTLKKEACALSNGKLLSKQAMKNKAVIPLFNNVFGIPVKTTDQAIEKVASLTKSQANTLYDALA